MSEKSIWSALERMRGHLAVAAEWEDLVGDDFPVFRVFLQPINTRAASLPCNECSCNHRIVTFLDGSLASVCRCVPRECRVKAIQPEDTVIWQLNWPKFAHAVCKAFGLQSKTTQFDLLCTSQIGSWSCDSVPVILTIQWNGHELPSVISELALRLNRPFILLAATNTHLTARCQELLAHAKSEFFALDSHLTLTAQGNFQPTKTPGEIFARFNPQPADDNDMVRKAIVLVKETDAGQGARKVSLYTVMRLYCLDCLSANQIARKCGCARSLVYSRLAELRQKLGRDPAQLRRYPDHLEKMEDSLSDSKAKRIHRKCVIDGAADSD